MGLDLFSSILRKIIEKNPQLALGLKNTTVLDRWPEVVGPLIAKHTRASKIDRGVLFVEVDHAAWKQELSLRRRDLIKRMNARAQGDDPILEDLFLIDNPRL